VTNGPLKGAMFQMSSSRRAPIRLLDADPELGDGLSPEERALAERALVVHTRSVEPGPWNPEEDGEHPQPVAGLLVVEGILTREIVFAGRATTELLGSGDVLHPWQEEVQFDALPFSAAWHVHAPARFAVLDARFAMAAGRWPALMASLGGRHVKRARTLAFQRAIGQLPRVDDRLLVLLWSLAERWGRVGPQGVRLGLNLPHRTLATLVGARRPSVTTALSGLTRAGLVERHPDGWLLHGEPTEVLAARLDGAAFAHAN
jgi:CRP/FNR family transcriptional regulator, cyclic AMP receptor protein